GSALRLMAMSRTRGARIVVGGPEPANYVSEYLQAGADVVVIGEGELTLEEILQTIQHRRTQTFEDVHGVAFRAQDGTISHTPARKLISDLDAQPWPDREAIDQQQYLHTW